MRSSMMLAAVLALAGCSFYARGPNDYRKAVRSVLDRQSAQVERCYKRELETDDKTKGKVVVAFDVEPKSGAIVNAKVVEKQTTGNAALQKCVLDSLQGLKLDPPDQRKGEATFTWEFSY